jgi:hypothetical protein
MIQPVLGGKVRIYDTGWSLPFQGSDLDTGAFETGFGGG